jgi:cytochrome P450
MTSLARAPEGRPSPQPQGPKGRWILGSLLEFAPSPHEFCAYMASTFGDVGVFKLGPLTNYLLAHPDDITEVLVRQAKHTHKHPVTQALSEFLGKGLLTNEDESWRTQRKLIAPVLGKKQVDAYAEAMVRHARAYLAKTSSEPARNLAKDMMAITLDVIAEVVFGCRVDSEVAAIDEEVETMLRYFNQYAQGWKRLLPRWLPTPLRRRFRAHLKRFDTRLSRIIDERRKNITDDLVSRLLLAEADDGNPMTAALVRDESITMMLAGHETTALALTYAIYLLCAHPEMLTRASTEARQVLGSRAAVAADFGALRFLTAVIKESLRLYPPAWGVGRLAMEDMALRGFTIERGQAILMSPWVVHRDPRWYDEPLAFKPERWLGDLEARLPRSAYMPFGDGPRVCVGNHFAMLEAVLILATILQSAELALIGEPQLRLRSTVTLRPLDPIPVRVTVRAD